MKIKLETSEKLLQHRRLFVGCIVVLISLLLLVLNLGNWIFLRQMRKNLENELDRRLFSIADLTAKRIAFEFEDYPKDQFYYVGLLVEQTLQYTLQTAKDENQLQAAFLIDNDYLVLADDDEQLRILNKRTYVKQDSLCLRDAWLGLTTVSPLHIVEGNHFKSAYAPIINAEGEVLAILVVEADADFFDILRFYQRGLIVSVLISLVLVIIFSIFLYWLISLLLKSYESMRRSERLAMMGQMAASVAHEIRNPLSIIKGTGDVLKEMYNHKDEPNELFDFIPSEVKRLNRIVTDLLSFARGPKLELQRSDIKATILRVKNEIEQEYNHSNISVETIFFETLPLIEYDPDAIHQVLFNIMLNSIQAMKNGGVVKITVGTASMKGKTYISIENKDSGCGIAGDVNKIFDPFFTTKSKGTGLGLAICCQIIEKHGGWIEAESQKDVGTKIRFYLPA